MSCLLLKGLLSASTVVLTVAFSLTGVYAKDVDKAKSETSASAGQKVDINSASLAEMEKLPGLGAVAAERIIARRPYTSITDLSKAGVSARTVERITPFVTVGVGQAAAPAAAPKMTEPTDGEKADEKAAAGDKVDINSTLQAE